MRNILPHGTGPSGAGGAIKEAHRLEPVGFFWVLVGVAETCAYTAKLDPQPQVLDALGLPNTNPRPMISSLKSITVPLRYR